MHGGCCVVHCKREDYDVYIGRGLCPKTGKKSIWYNPFSIGVDGSREDVIEKYKEYILNSSELMAKLPTLKDKRLGCWCVSTPIDYVREEKYCHGEVLLELVENL
jgi:hypothetical protein